MKHQQLTALKIQRRGLQQQQRLIMSQLLLTAWDHLHTSDAESSDLVDLAHISQVTTIYCHAMELEITGLYCRIASMTQQ